ncbi:MAG: hypothetical protein ACLSA6_03760 [Holdemania massiliensis]
MIFDQHPEYEKMAILERLTEPERMIQFSTVDGRSGQMHVNRGYASSTAAF